LQGCPPAVISKRSFLLSRRPIALLAPLLRKEIRELATGNSLWVLLLLLSPLVGYSFIQAVALYAEASRPGQKCDCLNKAVADKRRQQQQQNPKRIAGSELADLFAQQRCQERNRPTREQERPLRDYCRRAALQ